MNMTNLVFRNVKKNLSDYMIYFLTLMISVSMFYAFNSIKSQPAMNDLDATKQLLSDQLGILITALSVVVAIVLAFLIIYVNQFLLKRRKKELGIYTLLGMTKGKISRIFAGETFCVGIISLVCGLIFGLVLSQILSLISLKLFAIDLKSFQMIFSTSALKKTVFCFALIFFIIMLFNVRTISDTKLIDLLKASRKNEAQITENKLVCIILFILSIICIIFSGWIVQTHGILPSRQNSWFQIAVVSFIVGIIVFFYSISTAVLIIVQRSRKFYLKGLNAFLCRQIGSKIRSDFWILSIICGLLTIAICGVSVGISAAFTMNEASKSALPFNLNVFADPDICGETDIVEYLRTQDVDMEKYAEVTEQISLYEADMTYGDLFEGQDVALWTIDKDIPSTNAYVISITDFNRALSLQGKATYELGENEFLINCNYKGTFKYIQNFIDNHQQIVISNHMLQAAQDSVISETYVMTSVGNNDRGTFIVPDEIANKMYKDLNVLLVEYRSDTISDEVLQKMIPIGLAWETEGYRYTEKEMLNGMYYGVGALMVFLCCYIGMIFLLICAALLSLKQMTETADNIFRYGLLQKMGADLNEINKILFKQIAIFFIVPLCMASIFSVFLIEKVIILIENFMNMYIAANIGITVIMFIIVYGGYFLATYILCKRMIQEKNK